jgi:putative spermidine/putrescine transport system substrate-binding protein
MTKRFTSRRQVLKGAALGAAAIAAPQVLVSRKTRAAETLTVRDPGGPFTKAFQEAYYGPFSEKFGVEVVGVTSKHEATAEIKAQVDTGTFQYDVTILGEQSHNTLAEGGNLDPIGLDDVPAVQEIPAEFKHPTMVGNDVYATILAYRTDAKLPKDPTGWSDLWDLEGMPGRRGMRNYPFDTIEIGLLGGAGVPADKVYPCDFDKAYEALGKVRPGVDVWWTGGAQTSQLLANGEVDLCQTWNGRAQAAIDGGAPVKMAWGKALWGFEGWCLLKGNPKNDLGRKFIAFAAEAQNQANFTPHVAYGPTNPGAYKFIDPARAEVLPTNPKYFSDMVAIDSGFWGPIKDEAVDRWKSWMLG